MKNSKFSNDAFRGKRAKQSPYYESVRLTYYQNEIGEHHFNTAIGIIKATQVGFSETHETEGVLFCEKYLLRIYANQAYVRRNTDKLYRLIDDALELIKRSKDQFLYQPSHTKSLCFVYWKLGACLLKTGKHTEAQEQLLIGEKILFELEQENQSGYDGHKELLGHIQATLRRVHH
ncbi:MAG: hypothetical protein F9K23_18730 [Bacteroidetes bacterium]|nr:MAG: hypothetical protein F9K23_18730 [Bacteroidota bacterium]